MNPKESPKQPHIIWGEYTPTIILVVMVCAIGMAWVVHATSALTLNAFDLAEWTTLAPAQRQTTPMLNAALLLRLQLPMLIILGATLIQTKMLVIGIIVIGFVAQLPPLEFIRQLDDVNYQQQAIIAGISVFGATISWYASKIMRFKPWIVLIASILGVITTIGGIQLAFDVLAPFALTISIGIGYYLLIFGYVILGLISVTTLITQTRR